MLVLTMRESMALRQYGFYIANALYKLRTHRDIEDTVVLTRHPKKDADSVFAVLGQCPDRVSLAQIGYN